MRKILILPFCLPILIVTIIVITVSFRAAHTGTEITTNNTSSAVANNNLNGDNITNVYDFVVSTANVPGYDGTHESENLNRSKRNIIKDTHCPVGYVRRPAPMSDCVPKRAPVSIS